MTDWLDERVREVRESAAATRKIGSELGYLQLGWRPPDGGWSIAQVFEHLILTDTPYLAELPRLLANAQRGSAPWKPSFMGGLVTGAVEPKAPRKVKASSGFRPTPEPRAEVVADYAVIRDRLAELMEAARGVDLNRVKMKSPVMSIVRYNLGDAFMILTRHTQRHLQQIERVRNHPAFPREPAG